MAGWVTPSRWARSEIRAGPSSASRASVVSAVIEYDVGGRCRRIHAKTRSSEVARSTTAAEGAAGEAAGTGEFISPIYITV